MKVPTKACSLDPVPAQVFTQNVELLSGPVTNITNASLTKGVFPLSVKEGLARPSTKKPTLDKEVYSNYRPITNITFLPKLLERVVSTQFMNYLVADNLIAKFQSAYRCFRSTETAMLRVVNDILLLIREMKLYWFC